MAYPTQNPKAIDPAIEVAVAPTPTTLATFDVQFTSILTVQVENLDPSQTLDCTILRHAIMSAPFVDSGLFDLKNIQPGTAAAIDIQCGGNIEIRIFGTASGAGLTATICGRDKPRGRP